MDSFFSKGFKGSRCKTLLKLTIPRIKLLRNRREIQLKQMRRDIAKLLETGQEATARIRVEHIIREEKMMAAQEIIELFCELIAVRLPIIETQKECPIDLKEAISSVCFAAPRCADLPELIQVQMMFTGKYGKEFVARATELMPECGVNRQLIELLSVRAPAPDVKLKLLKDIAEEHELDWDPSASENELLKTHEDLLNGPTHFVSGYKVPLPGEKHEELPQASSEQTNGEKSDSDADLESWELPEVPKQTLKTTSVDVSAPEMLPFPASALSEPDDGSEESAAVDDSLSKESHTETEKQELRQNSAEVKQYIPFMSPPPKSPAAGYVDPRTSSHLPSVPATKSQADTDWQDALAAARAAAETPKSPTVDYVDQRIPSHLSSVTATKTPTDTDWQDALAAARAASETLRSSTAGSVDQRTPSNWPSVAATKSRTDTDLQDLLAAARAAAETAERAAVAARSAASLAEMKINEHSKRNYAVVESTVAIENPFHTHTNTEKSNVPESLPLDHQSSFDKFHADLKAQTSLHNGENHLGPEMLRVSSYDDTRPEYVSFNPNSYAPAQGDPTHQVQRLPSMDDEFSYPNLFGSRGSLTPSRSSSFADNSRSTPE